MKVCEHEFENPNCTNCANGLPVLAYECAKTKGELKEYCHSKAEEIHKRIREETIDEFKNMLLNGELYRCTDGNEYVDVADVEHCAEQLKERSND